MIQAWDETKPDDNGLAGDGDDEIKGLKARVKERMELDHHFSGELDPLEGDCDGYHKKITLKALDDDPTPLTGTGVIYTKEVDGIIELFFIDETTGVVNQLTEQGVLSLNTLQNNIDVNGKYLFNVGHWIPTGDQGLIVQSNNVFDKSYNASSLFKLKVSATDGGTGLPANNISIFPGATRIQYLRNQRRTQHTVTFFGTTTYYSTSFSEIQIIVNNGEHIFTCTKSTVASKTTSNPPFYPPYPAYPAYPTVRTEVVFSWPAGGSLAVVLP